MSQARHIDRYGWPATVHKVIAMTINEPQGQNRAGWQHRHAQKWTGISHVGAVPGQERRYRCASPTKEHYRNSDEGGGRLIIRMRRVSVNCCDTETTRDLHQHLGRDRRTSGAWAGRDSY